MTRKQLSERDCKLEERDKLLHKCEFIKQNLKGLEKINFEKLNTVGHI